MSLRFFFTMVQKVQKDRKLNSTLTVGPKLHFFDESYLCLFVNFSLKRIDWWKLCEENHVVKLAKSASKLLSSIDFLYKVVQKLAVSRTVFFVPCTELITRTDSRKAPKPGTIAHQHLVSTVVLGIFQIRSPCHFTDFVPKRRSILQTGNEQAYAKWANTSTFVKMRFWYHRILEMIRK